MFKVKCYSIPEVSCNRSETFFPDKAWISWDLFGSCLKHQQQHISLDMVSNIKGIPDRKLRTLRDKGILNIIHLLFNCVTFQVELEFIYVFLYNIFLTSENACSATTREKEAKAS